MPNPTQSPSSSSNVPTLHGRELARYFDHTALKPEVSQAQIVQLCDEAYRHQFMAVCVNPIWVKRCVELLTGSEVKVATVVGFPLGATLPEVKVFEAQCATAYGAVEIDMVINIGTLKDQAYPLVAQEIAAVVHAARSGQAITKVIIETALLTDEEKVTACRLAVEAGAEFVKTSTGFAASGATALDVALMRRTVGPDIGVKAAGGIRTYADALALIRAGANRLGASASVKIMQEAESAAQ
jgi:deoxyribose-phosphate aldolase